MDKHFTSHFSIPEVYVLLLWLFALIAPIKPQSDYDVLPTIEAESPIADALEGGMLSIYCRIRNLDQNSHVVVIERTTSADPERLTWNEAIMPQVEDERVFLATRHLGTGGEFAYFLTVIGIEEQDSGEYKCQVRSDSSLETITETAISVNVLHFPTDVTCNQPPPPPSPINVGDIVNINCTAGKTHPSVMTRWIRADTKERLHSQRVVDKHGNVFAQLNLKTTLKDVGALFICEVTSPYFQSKTLTCHVGPLSIHVDSSHKPGGTTKTPSILQTRDQHVETPRTLESCKSTCAVYKSPATYWMIGTVIACLLAFVFFIVVIVLCLKVFSIHSQPDYTDTLYSLHPSEDIYAHLAGRVDNSRLYMTLERPKKSKTQDHEDIRTRDGPYLVPFMNGPQM